MSQTYTASITLIAMNGSFGCATGEFDIAGPRKLDGPSYLDSVIRTAYEEVLELQEITLSNCAVSISGIYSGGQFHRYICHVSIRGADRDGVDIGVMSEEVHVYVDRSSIKLKGEG